MELDEVQRWHIGNLALAYCGQINYATLVWAELHYRHYAVDQWALTRLALQEKATGQRPTPEQVISTYTNYLHERN